MKMQTKIALFLLVALVAVLVLASCGGGGSTETTPGASDTTPGGNTQDTTPGGNTQDTTPGGNTQDTTTEDNTDYGDGPFTVTFVDPDGVVLKEHKNIKKGASARPPVPGTKWVLPDGKEFDEWDTDFSKVNKNMTVTAIYKDKAQWTVTFQDDNGTVLKEIKVWNNDGVDEKDIPIPAGRLGKYFAEWEKISGESKTINVVTSDMVMKAKFENTTAIAPYVTDKITVDGQRDEAYTKYSKEGDVYTNTFKLYNDGENTYAVYRKEATDTTPAAPCSTGTATAYVVWDGEWIYLYFDVYDETLGGRSYAYIGGTANAYLNDTIELWYNFEKMWTNVQNKIKVGIDAMGRRKFGDPSTSNKPISAATSMSVWFDDIKAVTAVEYGTAGNYQTFDKDSVIDMSKVKDHYRVEFAIPAKTEPTGGDKETGWTGHEALSAFDVLHMSIQMNDMQQWDAEDSTGAPTTPGFKYEDKFTANTKTQYTYAEYDTISLGAQK